VLLAKLTCQSKAMARKAKETKVVAVQADDLIAFRQLSKKSAGGDVDDVSLNREAVTKRLTVQSDYDLVKATGVAEVHDDFISKLSRIVPLTGT
jgi:coatomer subunit beta